MGGIRDILMEESGQDCGASSTAQRRPAIPRSMVHDLGQRRHGQRDCHSVRENNLGNGSICFSPHQRDCHCLRDHRSIYLEQDQPHDVPDAEPDDPLLHLHLRVDSSLRPARLRPGHTSPWHIWSAAALGNVPTWCSVRACTGRSGRIL